MRAPANEFQEYLAPDESVVEAGTGALLENAYRTDGFVGITDRRVLFVSDEDGFVGISQDGIHSIRSRPGTAATSHGAGYRLVSVAGAVLAVLSFVGVLALGASGLASVLALVTVGGLVSAEYLRRNGVETDWAVLADLEADLAARLDDVEFLRTHLDDAQDVDRQQLLILGSGLVALTAFAGLVAATASLLAIPLTLVTLGGIAVMDYAHRNGRDTGGFERNRRTERNVSIHLASGQVVELRVDSPKRIDRALSRATAGRAHETPATKLTRP